MKNIIRLLIKSCTFVILCLVFSVTTYAWQPPKINKIYEESEVELRAVWVCTVSNMDMPKLEGKDTESITKWKNAYLSILDNATLARMNTIIFQVRPCNDAFYPSKYNPWSDYLLSFGVDPGFDPLEWIIDVTHERGLDIHAWLNPYRASTTSLSYNYCKKDQVTNVDYIYDYSESELNDYKSSYYNSLRNELLQNNNLVDNPAFKEGSDLFDNVVLGTEGKFVLNPASDKTIELLNNTIDELVTNYELDGIHFDDYFYPNDTAYRGSNKDYKGIEYSTEPMQEKRVYDKYLANGGTLSIYDFRRDNVNRLIKGLGEIIRSINATKERPCAFGISPAAKYAPAPEFCPVDSSRAKVGGMNGSCNDYYSYSDLYADTYGWAVNDWIDYICPQNYTNLGDTYGTIPNGSYDGIVSWWSKALSNTTCKLFIGTPTYKIDEWSASGKSDFLELFYQIKWNDYKDYNVDGYVFFRYDSQIKGEGKKATDHITKYLFKNDALTPIYDRYTYPSLSIGGSVSSIEQNNDGSYTININQVIGAKAYAIMKDGKVVKRVLASESNITINKEDGVYTLVTYGMDNNIVSEYDTIDFTNVLVNQAPKVALLTSLDEAYKPSSKIHLEFEVFDDEDDDLYYSLTLYSNERSSNIATDQLVENNQITYVYTCDATTGDDYYFELIVKDLANQTTYTTAHFTVNNELIIETPSILFFAENDLTDTSITIDYIYKDPSSIVTNAYILVNDNKTTLSKKSDSIDINNLDFKNIDYDFTLVLEYTLNNELKTLKSDVLHYEKTQPTPISPKPSSSGCGATLSVVILSILSISILGYYLLKKEQ